MKKYAHSHANARMILAANEEVDYRKREDSKIGGDKTRSAILIF
jgi:hypothetical protein